MFTKYYNTCYYRIESQYSTSDIALIVDVYSDCHWDSLASIMCSWFRTVHDVLRNSSQGTGRTKRGQRLANMFAVDCLVNRP